ncbi:solute carrier family 35 member B1-like [Oscarella lobularis]|uniref:solute carrier family 35 member B1-like n=1 Tax=Oscarella lobularis TaxID=121494 RepID=UPI00331382FF
MKLGDYCQSFNRNDLTVHRRSIVCVMSDRSKLLICFSGIFFSYLAFGVFQEKITRGSYGDDDKKEKFAFFFFLVFFQCVANAIVAKIALWAGAGSRGGSGSDRTPTRFYAICALSYMGAMLASNSSLKYVSYPTQVLGKSCKPIPVMLLGVVFLRKHYPLAKYLVVLLIVSGVALFLYKDRGHAHNEPTEGFGWGEVLLFVSLFLDGLTGVFQDKLRSYHAGSFDMMLNLNLWSILILLPVLVVTGQGLVALLFISRHSDILYHLLAFGFLSALGQIFIFQTIQSFGPLTCSVITTTRKFFTILCSVVWFGNHLLGRQWFGVFLVFLGLTVENLGKSR